MRDQLVGGAKDVTALRASITSAVADIRAYTSEARNAAAAAQGTTAAQSAQAALYQASEAARGTVTGLMHDYYDRRIFDPYLKFASGKDEEEYRRREAETKRFMETELAKGTPDGQVNASAAMVRQLNDAEAHGAGASREFHSEKARALGTFHHLRDAMRSAGQSTEEADRIASSTTSADEVLQTAEDKKAPPLTDKAITEVDGLSASLRGAGITVPDQTKDGHGVTRNESQAGQARGA